MTSHSLRRLTALEEVKLLDGDQLAELLLVEGAQEQREGPLLRLARQIYRAQACTDDKETPGFKRCQWIAGEPSWNDDCKCSARAVEGAPWCGEHLARVHGRTERPAEHYIPASESGWALVLQEDFQ